MKHDLNTSPKAINSIAVSAVITGTWERRFAECIAASPEYIKETFVGYQRKGFRILRGTVEGSHGSEEFVSFEALYSILNEYEEPGPSVTLCA